MFRNNQKAQINKTYIPDEEESQAREHVYKRYSEMKQGREKYDKHWDDWRLQWEGWKPERNKLDWRSNIVAQLSTSIVETLMAEIQQYDIEPPIKARGYEDQIKAEIMKEAVKFSKQQGDFKIEEEDIKKEAFILGQAFGEELYWNDKREVRFVKTKVEKGKKIVYEDKQTVFTYDGMYLEHVPCDDMFFDESAKSINRGRGQANDAIRRYVMFYDAAKDFLSDPRFNNRDNLQYVRPGGDVGSFTEYYQYYQPTGRIDADDEVEVLFYWAKRPDTLVVVANDVVVHMGPNIYNHKMLPFVQAWDIRRTGSLYHKGEMELLESIQEELTKNKRMRLDRLHLTIDPMYLVSRRDNISETETLARPHGVIEADDPNSVKELRTSDTPQSAYKEEEYLLREAQRATGVDDGAQAVQRQSITATEFAGLRESTLKKVALKLWHIHNGFHVSHTRLRVANILQYWTQEKMKLVLGEGRSDYYQQLIQQQIEKGMIVKKGGDMFFQSYPTIRTSGRQIIRKGGQVSIKEAKGEHYFTVEPRDIIPYYHGYDIVYDGTPEIPLTKTLRQTKAAELSDRVLPVALSGVGGYDAGKIMDWLVRENGVDPDTFKQVQQDQQGADQLAQAQAENAQMFKGTKLSPTPYAVPQHTQIHTAFMKSQQFQQLDFNNPRDKQIIDAFTEHVQGELLAQENRQGEGQAPEVKGVSGQASQSQEQISQPGSKAGSSPVGGFIRRMLGRG